MPELVSNWAGGQFESVGNATQAVFDLLRSWADGTTVESVDNSLKNENSTAATSLRDAGYNVTRVRELLNQELAATMNSTSTGSGETGETGEREERRLLLAPGKTKSMADHDHEFIK